MFGPTFFRERFVQVLQISLIASLLVSIVRTQAPTCPPIWTSMPASHLKTSAAPVKLRLDSDFTPDERTTILQAFSSWSARSSLNCSGVTFDVENPTIAANQSTSEPELANSHWIGFDPSIPTGYDALTGTSSRPSAATVIYGKIRQSGTIPATNPEWLRGLMRHEIGHSFRLDDAGCSGSVMGWGDALQRIITTNDDNTVRIVYGCPTPTPTPYPTPDFPFGCDNPYENFSQELCPLNFSSDNTGFYCCWNGCEQQPANCGSGWSWSFEECNCVWNGSPIVIDVEGDGFDLTSAENGISFDLDSDGFTEGLSWTSAGSDDAWLVLDRNQNGEIDNGLELFGNVTEQPEPPTGQDRNGFLALAEFDKPANGGNADGIISREDEVFRRLRLWRDANHNGRARPAELFKLSELALRKILLDYETSRRMDEHGNRFRWRARVKDANDAQLGRWAWDVILVRQDSTARLKELWTGERLASNLNIFGMKPSSCRAKLSS